MKYLLDVNALVAWHHAGRLNTRLHAWRANHATAELASCAISDLGFIRISMIGYGYTLQTAEKALESIKRDVDDYVEALPPPRLARWVASHKQTTDAYLCQLAAKHGMQLLTFDNGIKDAAAFLIP
jgi:predicted nucleic acid-binding protein